MNGYTVFLGPITGIMITDVSLPFPLWSVVNIIPNSDYDSTGSYTTRASMFLRCTSHTAGIDILMVWYASFHRASTFVRPLTWADISQNWRAAAALLVSVPPTFPGLINSINAKIYIGTAGERLFDIAYLLGVSER
jgi:cytosine/uracil/thiamine/allantoin permease